jgi:hypothetical protein
LRLRAFLFALHSGFDSAISRDAKKVCAKYQRPDGCASGRKLFGVLPGVSFLEAMSVEPFIKKAQIDDNNVKELLQRFLIDPL